MPPGSARFKQGGGHGGHNGLRDIIPALGGNREFQAARGYRSSRTCEEVSDYVLAKPSKADRQAIDAIVDEAVASLPLLLDGDAVKAMTRLHSIDTRSPLRSDRHERVEATLWESSAASWAAQCRQIDPVQCPDRSGHRCREFSVLHHRTQRWRGAHTRSRQQQISALVNPEREIAATMEFVDIAGLVAGASKGEGWAISSLPISARPMPLPTWCAVSVTTMSSTSPTRLTRRPTSDHQH